MIGIVTAVIIIHANNKNYKNNMHISQATNTLSQSHNQLQNVNIHINFIFSLWQM